MQEKDDDEERRGGFVEVNLFLERERELRMQRGRVQFRASSKCPREGLRSLARGKGRNPDTERRTKMISARKRPEDAITFSQRRWIRPPSMFITID